MNWVNAEKVRDLNRSSNELIDSQIQLYLEHELLTYEDARLESKHNDFGLLMEEYHDGILLFELTDQKVWSKAVKDSAGLADTVNIPNCSCGQSVLTSEFTPAKTRKLRRKSGKRSRNLEMSGTQTRAHSERPLALRNEFGQFAQGENSWADRVFDALNNGTLLTDKNGLMILETSEEGNQIILVHLRQHLEPSPKLLKIAEGQPLRHTKII